MSSVQAFVSVMDEFLNELKKTFPEEKKIDVYLNSFKTMKKINPKAILEGFMSEAGKRSAAITARDEKALLSGDDKFMDDLNVKLWWNDSLSQNTKDAIWQYLNTLLILGTTITSIPQNLLETIEGVAEQCASQMEAGDGQVNPENMGSLLSGVQSMIGNLVQQQGAVEKK